nr:hypothetical protein L203_03538 [Cryptococcus depauperatus CBS 7841]
MSHEISENTINQEDIGMDSATVSEPGPSTMPTSAHPAFPSAPPPAELPVRAGQIGELLCRPVDEMIPTVIPMFEKVAEGKPFEGLLLSPAEKRALGEELLALYELGNSIYEMDIETIKKRGGALVYVLSARINKGEADGTVWTDELFDFSINLAAIADAAQLKVCHKRAVAYFALGILRLSQHLNKVNAAAPAINILIQKLAYQHIFSSIFGVLLEACLISRNYESASLALNRTFLDMVSTSPTYLDVLTYYHHAGTVYSVLGDFVRAKENFLMAVSLPTRNASAIQVSCAKRAILCELINNGKRTVWPQFTSNSVLRAIDKHLANYNELAKQFEYHNWTETRRLLSFKEFKKDCNKGLAERIRESIPRRMILKIRDTFVRLTVGDLAKRMKVGDNVPTVGEVIATLDQMTGSGDISATLTPSSADPLNQALIVVKFIKSSITYDGLTARDMLESAADLAASLERELADGEKRLGASEAYLRKSGLTMKTNSKQSDKLDDVDQMIAAEELFGNGRTKGEVRGAALNLADVGY